MTKLKRRDTEKTLKLLWGLSRGQCARPTCTNALIEPRTDESDDLVTGHICHILALNADGPRGKDGLTEKELNSIDNLLLLCPNCHAIVDGQHETYSADCLRDWKRQHEDKARAIYSQKVTDADRQPSRGQFPTSLVDREIENTLDTIKKGRFLHDFARVERCLQLGEALKDGEYSGGTAAVRCRALAWCARLLTRTEATETAREYLQQAEKLANEEEVVIAKALSLSHQGDHRKAFTILARLESQAARSASLVVASDRSGPAGAVRWANDAGVTAYDLDADGQTFLLGWLLELEDWDAAWSMLDALTPQSPTEAPALCRLTAAAQLASHCSRRAAPCRLPSATVLCCRFPPC